MSSEIAQGFALSPQQQDLWLLTSCTGTEPALEQRIPRSWCTVEITGGLEPPTLRKALTGIVRDYEILRTSFGVLSGMDLPAQVVGEAADVALEELDVAELDSTAREAKVLEIATDIRKRSLDLSQGHPLVAVLVRLAKDTGRLILALPALCADEIALDLLVRNLAARCSSNFLGTEVLQYPDIAAWENGLLLSAENQAARDHWAGLRVHEAQVASAPFELGSATVNGFFESVSIPLTEGVTAQVEAAAAATGGTARDVLLAVWAALLERLGEPHPLLGLISDGRQYEELLEAVGPLARLLPLALPSSRGMSLVELTTEIATRVHQAEDTQEAFAWSLEEEEPTADGGTTPGRASTLPCAFDFPPPFRTYNAGLSRFTILERGSEIGRFRLCLTCRLGSRHSAADNLDAVLRYDSAAFERVDVERLARFYGTFLAAALGAPEASLDHLEFLDGFERRRVVVEHNTQVAGELDEPLGQGLHHLIFERAEKAPDAVAVVDGHRFLSRASLSTAARSLAAALRSRDCAAETPVAIFLDRSLEMMVAVLAVLEAGGFYVPLDPSYPEERLELMLADSDADLLITSHELAEGVPGGVEIVFVETALTAVGTAETGTTGGTFNDSGLAYLIYTSGSTGRPKGVMVAHRTVVDSTRVRAAWYRQSLDSFLLLSSYAFDSSVAGIFGALVRGTVLELPPEGAQTRPAELAELIQRRRIGSMLTLPSLYGLLLRESERLSSLRTVIVAGEACTVELVRQHRSELPKASLHNEYGPTESTVWASVYDCGLLRDRDSVPIGCPIAGTRVYFLNRHQQALPSGAAGELCLSGRGLTRGYLRRPGITAERFLPDALSGEAGNRLYRTGDLACHAEDGTIEFLGRIDQQIKISGFRIEPGEVESALNTIPGVRESAVVAHADSIGETRLAAYVVAAGSPGLTVEGLREVLESQLPLYMIPAIFVPLGSFPRLPNGKVDFRALPSPEEGRLRSRTKYVPPRSPREERLVSLWAEVLRVKRVGIEDRFFSLGGDSILAIQVVSRAKEEGFDLTPQLLFKHQTVAALMAALGESATTRAQETDGEIPLTPVQRRILEALDEPPRWVGQALLLALRRPLTAGQLRAAWSHLRGHHDAMRLSFDKTAGHWRQETTAATLEPPFHVVDLDALESTRYHDAIDCAVTAARSALDPGRGLWRSVCFTSGEAASKLLMVHHSLIADATSYRLLLEHLDTALRCLERGDVVELPRATPFRKWTVDQATRSDVSIGQITSGHAQAVHCNRVLDEAVTRLVLKEAPEAYRATAEEVLLTVLGRALVSTHGGGLIVELEREARRDAGPGAYLEHTVGPVRISLPVALDLDLDEQPEESLLAVKERLRQDLAIEDEKGKNGTGKDGIGLQPQIRLCCLGPIETTADALWHPLVGIVPFSSQEPCAAPLDLTTLAIDGRLCLHWHGQSAAWTLHALEALAHRFEKELTALASRHLDSGVWADSPTDFPLAELDSEDLAQLSSLLEEIDQK